MTKEKLEQYILDNRDEFDLLEPSEKLWEGIKKKEQNPSIIIGNRFKWITRIAAAILIFLGSYYFHDYRSQQKQLSQFILSSYQGEQLYKTMVEAELYYTAQISVETEKLYQLTAGNQLVREEIQDELKELDREFSELKEDLKDNADNEDIIAAMIQNYRIKLRILQDMMFQLQEVKKDKNINDEIKRIQI